MLSADAIHQEEHRRVVLCCSVLCCGLLRCLLNLGAIGPQGIHGEEGEVGAPGVCARVDSPVCLMAACCSHHIAPVYSVTVDATHKTTCQFRAWLQTAASISAPGCK
jgi:hypothetical protein